MLMIRLSRVGKKKYPTYRIVLQDKKRDPWGKTNEFLGTYNPHTKEFACQEDRIKYWMSVGAQLSATVNNLLIRKGIITGKKMKAAIHRREPGAAAAVASEAKPEAKKEEPKIDAPTSEEKPVEEAKIEEPKTEEVKKESSKEKPAEEEKKAEEKPAE